MYCAKSSTQQHIIIHHYTLCQRNILEQKAKKSNRTTQARIGTKSPICEGLQPPQPGRDVAASQHVQDMGEQLKTAAQRQPAPHKLISRYQIKPLQWDSQGPVVSKSLATTVVQQPAHVQHQQTIRLDTLSVQVQVPTREAGLL
jgi:hypothetical protein